MIYLVKGKGPFHMLINIYLVAVETIAIRAFEFTPEAEKEIPRVIVIKL